VLAATHTHYKQILVQTIMIFAIAVRVIAIQIMQYHHAR